MVSNLAFVTSSGRTGTSFLTKLINEEIDNAWSQTEPKPAFKRRGLEILSREPSLYEKTYFKSFRWYRNRGRSEKWYVETNHKLFSLVPYLREWYDDPLIVHVVRDGRAVVKSWLNNGKYLWRGREAYDLAPKHLGDNETQKEWSNWTPLQKMTWYWKTKVSVIEDADPDLTLKFEDVFTGDYSGVFRLLDSLTDVEYSTSAIKEAFDEKINQPPSEFVPPYEKWPEHWREQFWKIGKETMANFDYDT